MTSPRKRPSGQMLPAASASAQARKAFLRGGLGQTWRRWAVLLSCLALGSVLSGKPITFVFRLPPDARNPFQRELWAEVLTPRGGLLRVPVFYSGEAQFAARVLGSETGKYHLTAITETNAGPSTVLAPEFISGREIANPKASARPFVRRNPGDPRRFVLSDGAPFVPLGTNLAWADSSGFSFYKKAFSAFGAAGLNWARIWMASWGGLNLDWLPEKESPSPELGRLDLRVAERWDSLLDDAEENGIYVQVVLQHHGQYSTMANPNWGENPWNADNPGGFLQTPGEFFTSPQARALTKWKYRYIVARWGWSPAVMAWELFNEVHFTDANNLDHNEAALAAWHAEMATYLRSIDTYEHLVTTSFDKLSSPLYTTLDYYQPHLYAANMLANPRVFEKPPGEFGAPIFYGEVGDDHMPLSPEQKTAGVALAPLVWASLFGVGSYPAQLWLGDEVLRTGRLNELASLSRFLGESHFGEKVNLTPFSPAVESADRVPLTIVAGQSWEHHAAPHITVPLDGREPLELAWIPQIFVGGPKSVAEGYPDRATFQVTYSHPATVHLRAADASPAGASLRLLVDGFSAAEYRWEAPNELIRSDFEEEAEPNSPTRRLPPGPPRPVELAFTVPAGTHTFTLENAGGPDWWALGELDFGLDRPALAAVGKRNKEFLALWIWHRINVFTLSEDPAAAATLILQDVPPGRWRIVWWNTRTGQPDSVESVDHQGGNLKVHTPAITRHAAVFLTKDPSNSDSK